MSSSENYYTQNGGLFNFNNCSKNNDIFLKAYRKGEFESLKFMIENNMVSDFAHGDRYGNTILHYTVVNQDNEFIKYLLQHIDNDKKVINKQNKKGDTPLHVAVRKDLKCIADLLIENGACPTIKNNDGYFVKKVEEKENYLVPLKKFNFDAIDKNIEKDIQLDLLKSHQEESEEENYQKFLFNLTNKLDKNDSETIMTPLSIFMTPDMPKKNNNLDINSVGNTEDLYKLLHKFDLVGGGKQKNEIKGTRKLFNTLSEKNRKKK
jgi:ankyrin repeat protein